MNYKSMYIGHYFWFQIEVISQFWHLSHCFTGNKECMLLEKDQHNKEWYHDNFSTTLYGVPADCCLCYLMKWVKPFMSCETPSMVYYAYFHSIMNTGLTFWGDSSHSAEIFRIQKNIIGIITGYKSRDSCRDFFQNLKILPPHSQYVVSLLLFVVKKKNKFKFNSDICHTNTRQKYNCHQHLSNLSLHQNESVQVA
jgi:hypothetical protein